MLFIAHLVAIKTAELLTRRYKYWSCSLFQLFYVLSLPTQFSRRDIFRDICEFTRLYRSFTRYTRILVGHAVAYVTGKPRRAIAAQPATINCAAAAAALAKFAEFPEASRDGRLPLK